jgi:hypothetical protein
MCGVEVWRGGFGGAYRLPTLSSVGALEISLAPPCFRFHTPLIEPDVRICRIRLSRHRRREGSPSLLEKPVIPMSDIISKPGSRLGRTLNWLIGSAYVRATNGRLNVSSPSAQLRRCRFDLSQDLRIRRVYTSDFVT